MILLLPLPFSILMPLFFPSSSVYLISLLQLKILVHEFLIFPFRRVLVTASQLDLPSLTPLPVAGCGRLQLGVADWANSKALLQVVDN